MYGPYCTEAQGRVARQVQHRPRNPSARVITIVYILYTTAILENLLRLY